MAGGIQLVPLRQEIVLDLDNYARELDRASSLCESAGTKISKVGSTLTKAVTLPLAGIGVVAGKMAVDFETSFAKVSTLLDSNVVNFDEYKNDLLQASNDSKIAVDEFSESVYGSISAGVDQTKAIEFTTDAMKLAKGGFTDGAKSVDVLTTAINGYSLTAEDAQRISDLLITTQNLGKTTVDELASSMGTVIPVAASVNFEIEELNASYAQLTKNGIATAESGTYLKAMLSELGKSGSITDKALRELTGKGFADLKKEGKSTTEILGMLDETAKKDDKSLKDMFGSVEAGSAALVLYKNGGTEYTEMLNAMGSSAGATQEAFDKMDATPAERMKGAINELKNESIKLGQEFIPVVEKVADGLSSVTKKFAGLSDEQKVNALKWTGVAMAAGPVMKVLGTSITTIGKVSKSVSVLTTAISTKGLLGVLGSISGVAGPVGIAIAGIGAAAYTAHEQADLMNSSVLKSREEMGWLEKVLADTQGVMTYTNEELEEMGLKYKVFSGGVSDEFQKAVKNSAEEVHSLSLALGEVNLDEVFTKEESTDINNRINKLVSDSLSTINARKEEVGKGLSDLFTVDDATLSENEQKVLGFVQSTYTQYEEDIAAHKESIDAILQASVTRGDGIRAEERRSVEAHLASIKQIELLAQAGNEEELLYAKNDFIARAKNLDLQGQSDLLQEKAKLRDEEIIKIQAAYDTQIEILKRTAEKSSDLDKRKIEAEIRNLESAKDDKIKMQNDYYDEYIKIATDGNENALENLDEFNGKILSQKEIASKKELEQYLATHEGMQQIQQDGYVTMYDTETQQWRKMFVNVDENTKKIVGVVDTSTGETIAYNEKFAKSTNDLANKFTGAYRLIGNSLKTYETNGQLMVRTSDGIEHALKKVEERTDGTKTAIIELNGEEVQVKVDKEGIISNLNEIEDKLSQLSKPIFVEVNTKFQGNNVNPYIPKSKTNSSNYNGLNRVPFDGYTATLHKDEMVLTKDQAASYRSGNTNQIVNVSINQPVKSPREIERTIRKAGRELLLRG